MTRTIDTLSDVATTAAPVPPCAVYDADTITKQVQRLRAYLRRSYENSRIHYAVKACYLRPVVRHIVSLGCGLEIMSPIEHRIAACFAVTGPNVVWNGPALDEPTLRGAVDRHERINVDSVAMFNVIQRLAAPRGAPIAVGLRLNLTGHGKLGITPDLAEPLLRSSRVSVVGFHIHDGTRSRGPAHWVGQRQDLLELLAGWEQRHGIVIQYIDVGGGLEPGHEPHVYLDGCLSSIGRLHSEPQLLIEPGAYLVEEAGTALARVVSVKSIGSTRWAVTDLGSQYLVPLDRSNFHVDHGAAHEGDKRMSIAGPMCFEADVVAHDQVMDVQAGHVVRVSRCGAYTASMSSCFGAPPPCLYWQQQDRLQRIERVPDGDQLFFAMHGYGDSFDCKK